MARTGLAEEEKELQLLQLGHLYRRDDAGYLHARRPVSTCKLDLYANNEELLAKLKEGNPGYDVIVPSDYMVETMLTRSISGSRSITRRFRTRRTSIRRLPIPAYDPGLKHSVPYMWGTVGIGYRKSKIEERRRAGVDCLDSDKYSGRIALLADQRVVLGVALKYLGFSMNSTNPDEINKARDLIIKQKPHIKAFAPDEGQNMLARATSTSSWSGTATSCKSMPRTTTSTTSSRTRAPTCSSTISAFPRMRRIRRMRTPSSTMSTIRT